MTTELQNLRCELSERSFVGCVVASQGTVLDEIPATDDHFFDSLARTVFGAANGLYRDGLPVNQRTVVQRIGLAGIEALGGIGIVTEACSYPSCSQARYFFDILEGKLALRRGFDLGLWASTESKLCDDPRRFVVDLQNRAAALDTAADAENVLGGVLDAIDAKVERLAQGHTHHGFAAPLRAWNTALGGILEGQLYGLAGRPGTGKTALMEQIIQAYLEKEIPVTVFEKDMSPQKLIERMVCRATRVPFWKFSKGFITDVQIRNLKLGVELFRGSPLYLYNPRGLTAEKMCAIARRDIRTKGVKAVFLDHIQAIRVGRDLREGLTQASLTLRANVTDTNVPHIVLAHINRNGAKGRPAPEDIKEFDQLYGDSDAMVLLWTEKARAEMEAGKPYPVQFYVAKNRDGAVVEEEIMFDGANLTFTDKAQ